MRGSCHTGAALVAVGALAHVAAAQSFEARVGFRSDQGTANDPNIIEFAELPPPGGDPVTFEFSMTFGAFNAQGVTNYGFFNWTGDLTGAGTGFTIAPGGSENALRSPYTLNPLGAGVVSGDGMAINNIDAAANITATNVFWFDGQPEPTAPPTLRGIDSYYQTYRFTVTLTDLTLREITFTASGTMQIVTGWTNLGSTPPDPDNPAVPGFVTWAGTQTLQADASGSFTLLLPAPGAAALLSLGGLVAARRRRD